MKTRLAEMNTITAETSINKSEWSSKREDADLSGRQRRKNRSVERMGKKNIRKKYKKTAKALSIKEVE